MSSRKAQVFEKLEEAFERGLKGKVESFDIWLRGLAIDPETASPKSVSRFLLEHVEETVDREKDLASIVEFVGFYLREKEGLYFVSIIGIPGVGKSHLLRTVQAFVEKAERKITSYVVDASAFPMVHDSGEENQEYLRILDQLKSKKIDILLIDSCEKDKNVVESLRGIVRSFSRGVIITAWTPHHWGRFRDKIEEFIQVSKEIHLQPFTQELSTELISRIVSFVWHSKLKINLEVKRRIQEFSFGVPSLIIAIMARALAEAFHVRRNNIDEESIISSARFLGVHSIHEKLSKLADHQVLLLKHILMEADGRGTRPSTLVELLGKDKATISYHLTTLSSAGLLKNERSGRWVFYRIPQEIVPLVAHRVSQEVEFLD